MTRIAVLDDDPTGSQTVHGVSIVLALDDAAICADGRATFFLTNTRSLPETEAAALTERVARRLLERAGGRETSRRGAPPRRALGGAGGGGMARPRRAVTGRGYDA